MNKNINAFKFIKLDHFDLNFQQLIQQQVISLSWLKSLLEKNRFIFYLFINYRYSLHLVFILLISLYELFLILFPLLFLDSYQIIFLLLLSFYKLKPFFIIYFSFFNSHFSNEGNHFHSYWLMRYSSRKCLLGALLSWARNPARRSNVIR